MNLRFTGRHVGVPAEDREYAEGKLRALSRYHRRLDDMEVFVERDGSILERVEIVARSGRLRAVAVGQDHGFRPAFDRAVDALRRQLQKNKEKVVSRRRRAGSPARGGRGR